MLKDVELGWLFLLSVERIALILIGFNKKFVY